MRILRELNPKDIKVFEFDPTKKYTIFIDATKINPSSLIEGPINPEIDCIILPVIGDIDKAIQIFKRE